MCDVVSTGWGKPWCSVKKAGVFQSENNAPKLQEQVSKEMDTNKLTTLVAQLCAALDERHPKSQPTAAQIVQF